MILLESLYATNFKGLREVSLIFPERGSVLVEGLNESGKSTLFESVYFGLYGRPLVSEDGFGGLDGVIRYEADTAVVELSLCIDATRLRMRRTLQRGKPQQIALTVLRPGQPAEVIKYVSRANSLIVSELGNLDEAALLNSCFVEQKKLDKLEDLSRNERQDSLMKLLNLEKLQDLERQFRVSGQDEEAIERARQRLELAGAEAELPEVEAQRAVVEERLKALGVLRAFEEIERQQGSLHQAEGLAEALAVERRQLEARLAFVERLRQAEGLIGTVVQCLQRQEEDQSRAAATAREIEELDEKECELLPRRRERVAQFEALAVEVDGWQRLESEGGHASAEIERLEQRRRELDQLRRDAEQLSREFERSAQELAEGRQELVRLERLSSKELPRLRSAAGELRQLIERLADPAQATGEADLDQARQTRLEARGRLRLAQVRGVLHQWTGLSRAIAALEQSEDERQREQAHLDELRAQQLQAASRRRTGDMLAGAILLATLATAGAIWLWFGRGLTILPLVAGGALSAWLLTRARHARALAAGAAQALAGQEHSVQRIEARRQAAVDLGGGRHDLEQCEQLLETLREPVPAAVEAAEGRLGEIGERLGGASIGMLEEQEAAASAKAQALEDEVKARLTRAEHDLEARAGELARQPGLEARLDVLQQEQTARLERLSEVRARLDGPERGEVEEQLSGQRRRLSDLEERKETLLAALQPRLALFQLPLDLARVRQAFGQASAEVEALERELTRRGGLRQALETHLQAVDARGREARDHERELERLELSGLPLPPGSGERDYREKRAKVAEALRSCDEEGTRASLARVDQESGAAQNQARQAAGEMRRLRHQAAEALPTWPGEVDALTREAAIGAWPLLADVEGEDEGILAREREQLIGTVAALRHKCSDLRMALLLDDTPLDPEACADELYGERHRVDVKRLAGQIVGGTRARMVAKVLPNTEHNMRSILPLLTGGRYHDAQIDQDRFRIRVYDETARRYVSKNIFSGGTRDQFSLALRLAFALATLPQELGTTPGFIFLDEPLSSFDEPRTRALVDLLTHGQIAENFQQIFVISHSRSFDADLFTHHVAMVEGAIDRSDTNLEQAPAEWEAPQALLLP